MKIVFICYKKNDFLIYIFMKFKKNKHKYVSLILLRVFINIKNVSFLILS